MTHVPVRREELGEIFRPFEKPPEQFRIGAENEKFGVHQDTGAPLNYGGDFSVCRVLKSLEEHHDWKPIVETDNGPVLGLTRGAANITLEPSAQVELSGEPLVDLHQVGNEQQQHLAEIAPVSREMKLAWLGTGFHPFSRLDELTWVPKKRYPIMRAYLPKKGKAGLDMMQRTATVQGNFDWSTEADAMKKLRVALRLAPLMQAWFSNAPFSEGRAHGTMSSRGEVWRNMDPSRSGLVDVLWGRENPTYDDYVEWSLDAGMFLFWRDGVSYENTGQSFRDFLHNGYQGHRATMADFKLHLATLFPEARLKNTLEVRSVDGLPPHLALSSLAIWTGILYDDTALNAADQLLSEFSVEQMQAARDSLIARGLHGELLGRSGFDWAEKIYEAASDGLERRRRTADGNDERVFLSPAKEILTSRTLPAERALARVKAGASLVEATRIALPV